MAARWLLLLLSAFALVSAQPPIPIPGGNPLEDFDLICLQDMIRDPAALDALQSIPDATDALLDPTSLLNVRALELSEHVQCIEFESSYCGHTRVFPPKEQVAAMVSLIGEEINSKSDDEILAMVNYDVDGLCQSVTDLEAALLPYNSCVQRNLDALALVPQLFRDAIMELLRLNSRVNGTSAWDFDLNEVLQLSAGCASFKTQAAQAIRTQLSSQFWTDTFTNALANFDAESFEARIGQSANMDSNAAFGCTLPLEIICTKQQATYYSTCELVAENNFDFQNMVPIDGQIAEDSEFFEAFRTFNEQANGAYPCSSAFNDSCLGAYLYSPTPIPDLELASECRSAIYYYALTGTTPGDGTGNPRPTPRPTGDGGNPNPTPSNGTPAPTPTPGDGTGNGTPAPTPGDGTGKATPAPTTGSEGSSGENEPETSPARGLSAGGKAAIALTVIGLVGAAVGVGGYMYYRKRKGDFYQLQLE